MRRDIERLDAYVGTTSTNAPLRGTTRLCVPSPPRLLNFNIRTPTGCDCTRATPGVMTSNFNTRTPMGCDTAAARCGETTVNFNTRIPTGCDGAATVDSGWGANFNTRTPTGCDSHRSRLHLPHDVLWSHIFEHHLKSYQRTSCGTAPRRPTGVSARDEIPWTGSSGTALGEPQKVSPKENLLSALARIPGSSHEGAPASIPRRTLPGCPVVPLADPWRAFRRRFRRHLPTALRRHALGIL
jgi:hypothetical protein